MKEARAEERRRTNQIKNETIVCVCAQVRVMWRIQGSRDVERSYLRRNTSGATKKARSRAFGNSLGTDSYVLVPFSLHNKYHKFKGLKQDIYYLTDSVHQESRQS